MAASNASDHGTRKEAKSILPRESIFRNEAVGSCSGKEALAGPHDEASVDHRETSSEEDVAIRLEGLA